MLIWLGKQYLGQTDRPVEESYEEMDPQEVLKMLTSLLKIWFSGIRLK